MEVLSASGVVVVLRISMFCWLMDHRLTVFKFYLEQFENESRIKNQHRMHRFGWSLSTRITMQTVNLIMVSNPLRYFFGVT